MDGGRTEFLAGEPESETVIWPIASPPVAFATNISLNRKKSHLDMVWRPKKGYQVEKLTAMKELEPSMFTPELHDLVRLVTAGFH